MSGSDVVERMDLFATLAERRTDEIVVMTMTATLQWPLVSDHPLDFDFLAFGMGHASDFGMGLALARPERKTIVLKGDGGLLMSLGSLVTLGRHGPENLVVLLLENRSYEMTGGQSAARPRRLRGAGTMPPVSRAGGATGQGKVMRHPDARRLHGTAACDPERSPAHISWCSRPAPRTRCHRSITRITPGASWRCGAVSESSDGQTV